MGSYLHVYIKPNKDIAAEQIQEKMNLAIDWYRYDDGIYVLYTTSTVDKWQERLQNFVEDGGKLFICKFAIDERSGFMNSDFWDWLKKSRKK